MKKSVLFSALLLLLITAFAQKEEKPKAEYDKKTGIVSVSGTPVFKVEREKSSVVLGGNVYNFKTNGGKLFLIFNQNQIPGADGYYDIVFADNTELKADCPLWGIGKLVQVVYDNQLLKNGEPDAATLKLFAAKMGTNFNDRRYGKR